MVADSSSAAVRALHDYYEENDDRPRKNQQGSLAKLVQCASQACSMLFATLFVFLFVAAGVAIASVTENSVFCRDLGHLSQPEAGDDKDEETIKPSLQKGEPKTTANDE
ncbi:hypothetical protein O6H91_22G040800 [Diphasiastrum complanatum]|uniref:Uncharacterized protein n=1 Tax=Diphasiastrum complanatum TaxID=34168 RepID=A0ACC2AER3_DIPCM|nr:hypothetical protein O6H91_22G040800 [Diphasiastrum complanatum]